MLYDANRKKQRTVLQTIIWLIFIIIVLFLCLFPILCFGGAFTHPMTPKIAQQDYNKYEEQFHVIVRYISDNNIRDFYINKSYEIEVSDEKVRKALEDLMRAGYSPIGIEKTTVYFQKYATLDCGKGILCSLDGAPPYLQFLTDTKALDAENWYYYEDDYNEWRVRHRKNSNE